MQDFSEVTCHAQKDLIRLIAALNDKKWIEAQLIASKLESDMNEVANFANIQHRRKYGY